MVKFLPANAGDAGLIPGLGRFLEEGNATHSVFLPRQSKGSREEPDRLQSLGPKRVGHSLATEQQ